MLLTKPKPYKLLALITYGTCIYLLSSIPGEPTNNSNPSFLLSLIPSSLQNLLHIPLYAGLTSCLLWVLAPIGQKKPIYIIVFSACLAFAVSDEAHQIYVPGRFGSLSDVVLDAVGIILGIYIHNIQTQQNKLSTRL